MLCHHCGTANPETNKFCGNCGTRLVSPKLAEPVLMKAPPTEPALPASYWEEVLPPDEAESKPPKRSEPSISGPSFLGLTDASESDETSYLLDDDQPRRRGGWLVFSVFALIVFAGIGYLEWQTAKTGRLSIPFISKPATDQAAKPTPTNPAANDSNALAESAEAKPSAIPQTDKTDNNTDSMATTDNDNNPVTPINPQPTTMAQPTAADSSVAASSSQPSKADAPSTTASSDQAKINDSTATPEADQQVIEADQTRQLREARERREGSIASNSADTASPAAKPKAKAADAVIKPETHENRDLVLGENYLYGHGVPQSCNQALTHFRAAAEQKNAPAMAHLGAMYASGNCVPLDRVTAFSWLARAQNIQPTDLWLQRNMNMLWRDMTPEERAAINK